MSKGIKKVASIALPIAGAIIGGPVGGAIGGAIGGGISGGLPGAVIGGIGGYASAGAVGGLVGHAAGAPLETVSGVVGAQGPTLGSGITGAVTGGGVRALGAGLTAGAGAVSPVTGLTGIANQLMTQENADATEKAAREQVAATDRAVASQQPYNKFGQEAMGQIKQIQADPAGYIKNNPLYTSLAKDAERRLLANEAARGKVGSGGTAAALQDQLLQLGTGLVNNQINTLQNQVNTGAAVSSDVAKNQIQGGDAASAGIMGKNNVYQAGYQNQISTLLALQNLGRVPTYAPTAPLNL